MDNERPGPAGQNVDEQSIAGLPSPVRQSLYRSGVVGHPVPKRVTLHQRGQILLRDRWFPFEADEAYTVDPPGFEWQAAVRFAGVPIARATDSLAGGHGRMRVRLLGLFTVVDETGPAMDQGSLMRWLNETMWFPHVWATELVTWRPLDDTAAIGSVSTGGTSVEAEFRFDSEGRLVDFHADRYRVGEAGPELIRWATPLTAHRRFAGIEVPSEGAALWAPDDGDVEYIRIRVDSVRFE
jgi:hypothetical protein